MVGNTEHNHIHINSHILSFTQFNATVTSESVSAYCRVKIGSKRETTNSLFHADHFDSRAFVRLAYLWPLTRHKDFVYEENFYFAFFQLRLNSAYSVKCWIGLWLVSMLVWLPSLFVYFFLFFFFTFRFFLSSVSTDSTFPEWTPV